MQAHMVLVCAALESIAASGRGSDTESAASDRDFKALLVVYPLKVATSTLISHFQSLLLVLCNY
jgi:hypothetical protein